MATPNTAGVRVQQRDPATLVLALSGDWLAQPGLPGTEEIEQRLESSGNWKTLAFDTAQLGRWNTGLLAFLLKCRELCQRRHVEFEEGGLPQGVRQLLRLTQVAAARQGAARKAAPSPFVQRVGEAAIRSASGAGDVVRFIGEAALALGRLVRGRAQFRWSDALLAMQQCGPNALGIVALINFLVGMILAFVGSVQLTQFGASIYVADLVAIATVREMGCIMTGIILCGRTGASFAAELGTMKVNQEIDALKTFGVSPVEFLVLPRVIALVLMMPLLTVFADVIAIAGGIGVATMMLDITWTEYLNRTLEAVTLPSFALGVCKGGFFGILVALAGCLRGMQCGRDAAAVGLATTAAVVAGITSIIAADGVFAILCNALKI